MNQKNINIQISELSYFVYNTLINKIKVLEEKNKDYEKKVRRNE